MRFCYCDLDLDPMTLIYKHDLKILKTYLHTKNKLSRSSFQSYSTTDRQTDKCDLTHYHVTFADGNNATFLTLVCFDPLRNFFAIFF